MHIPEDEPFELSGVAELTEVLNQIRRDHLVSENWILVPDSNVGYDVLIGAIDAARAAEFSYVTVAGGAK